MWRAGIMTEKVKYMHLPISRGNFLSLLPSCYVKEMFLLPACLDLVPSLFRILWHLLIGTMPTNQKSPSNPCSTLVLLFLSPFHSAWYLSEFYFPHCLYVLTFSSVLSSLQERHPLPVARLGCYGPWLLFWHGGPLMSSFCEFSLCFHYMALSLLFFHLFSCSFSAYFVIFLRIFGKPSSSSSSFYLHWAASSPPVASITINAVMTHKYLFQPWCKKGDKNIYHISLLRALKTTFKTCLTHFQHSVETLAIISM